MANILITGGRAPVALELARIFRAAGETVFLAESQANCLAAASLAAQAHFVVPPPRQRPGDFIEALARIMREQRIDLLVPTCEEVFWLGLGRERLAREGRVLVEPIARLEPLHNKLRFVELARGMGLRAPETVRVEFGEDLRRAAAGWAGLVLKPVYSRFATRTLIRPSLAEAERALASGRAGGWVAQEFVAGRQVCSYSLAQGGRLAAHVAYRADFTAGQGAAVYFRACAHAGILEWVRRFVGELGFSGQISFDFIENTEGELYALECNPRATSGIHLFRRDPRFPGAFWEGGGETVFADEEQPAGMLALAMLVYGLPGALRRGRLGEWWEAFRGGEDVIWRWTDPLPALAQMGSLADFWRTARREGISALEASTWDIEWNGEGGV